MSAWRTAHFVKWDDTARTQSVRTNVNVRIPQTIFCTCSCAIAIILHELTENYKMTTFQSKHSGRCCDANSIDWLELFDESWSL